MTTVLEQPKENLFTRFNGKVSFMDEQISSIKCMGIYYVDLGNPEGNAQGGIRPCLVISNNRNNKYNSMVMVIPFTSKQKTELPVHVTFSNINEIGLSKESTLLCEQLTNIPKNKVKSKIGEIRKWTDLFKVVKALMTQIPVFNILL